eukprot:318375-Rhodomonas_salina.2
MATLDLVLASFASTEPSFHCQVDAPGPGRGQTRRLPVARYYQVATVRWTHGGPSHSEPDPAPGPRLTDPWRARSGQVEGTARGVERKRKEKRERKRRRERRGRRGRRGRRERGEG